MKLCSLKGQHLSKQYRQYVPIVALTCDNDALQITKRGCPARCPGRCSSAIGKAMFRMLAVLAEITELTGVSKATLYRRLKEHDV